MIIIIIIQCNLDNILFNFNIGKILTTKLLGSIINTPIDQ